MMCDISHHPATISNLNNHIGPAELLEMFPSRRSWIRLSEKDRKCFSSSTDLNIAALQRTILTTHIRISKGQLLPPDWYIKLKSFIELVQQRVNLKEHSVIQKPKIIAIKKEDTLSCMKFRPISQFALFDSIIIGQTARYLTAIFDDQLLDCAYAFRSRHKDVGMRTHHHTIESITAFRRRNKNKDIFIAECDIKKFFDCVNQDLVKVIYEGFVKNLQTSKVDFDVRASLFFFQYLDSYAFNLDVYPLNGTKYFIDINCPNGEFEWPESDLKKQFYKDGFNHQRIGVPQGGALSCLISNLLLHNVDKSVLSKKHIAQIEYLRFCDDMILLSTDLRSCELALGRYSSAIRKNLLLIHNPEEIGIYGKDFYNSSISKSKKPFLWSASSMIHPNSPWISFVGYQIKYDCAVRVRRKSLEKELNKQKEEIRNVRKAIRTNETFRININSRKSLGEQVFSAHCRLISMSVGRIKLYNYKNTKPSLCWTSGFKQLSSHLVVKTQLRLLDSNRNRQLFKLKKELGTLNKISKRNSKPGKFPTKYFGSPFSYYSGIIKPGWSKEQI